VAGKLRVIIAHHEASHAVVARKLGIDVAYVSARGRVARTKAAAWSLTESAALIDAYQRDAIVSLAGPLADQRLLSIDDSFLDIHDAEDQDMANANANIYRSVCLRNGTPCSDEPAQVVISEEMNAALWMEFDRLKAEAGCLVAQHWRAIQRVAKSLQRHDRIDQAELDRLIAVSERLVAA
jgi:hypothetical protein